MIELKHNKLMKESEMIKNEVLNNNSSYGPLKSKGVKYQKPTMTTAKIE